MTSFRQKHFVIPTTLFFYLLLLFFGSLHPITTWETPDFTHWLGSFEIDTKYTPKSDLITNLLIYIPLGLLLSLHFASFSQNKTPLVKTLAIAVSISLGIEFMQLFIPSRAQSFVDITMNILGASLGILLYTALSKNKALGARLNQWRCILFYRGRFIDLGILVIVIWMLSNLSPFLPTLSAEQISSELLIFGGQLGLNNIGFYNILANSLEMYALLVIFNLCLKYQLDTLILGLTFCITVMILKLPVDGISINIESVIGVVLGALIYFLSKDISVRYKTNIAVYAITLSYIISQLNQDRITNPADIASFNWIPFSFQSNRIQHINDILNVSWIFGAISFLIISFEVKLYRKVWLIGAAAIGICCFAIEWQQQYLQRVSADLTIVLIAMVAWTLPFLHPGIRRAIKSKPLP